jgi:hypothetical protein
MRVAEPPSETPSDVDPERATVALRLDRLAMRTDLSGRDHDEAPGGTYVFRGPTDLVRDRIPSLGPLCLVTSGIPRVDGLGVSSTDGVIASIPRAGSRFVRVDSACCESRSRESR